MNAKSYLIILIFLVPEVEFFSSVFVHLIYQAVNSLIIPYVHFLSIEFFY